MAKITISDPNSPYKCMVDTENNDVDLRDVFLGVRFLTDQGAALSVCMRDNGFEVRYVHNINDHAFNDAWTELKDGQIKLHKE